MARRPNTKFSEFRTWLLDNGFETTSVNSYVASMIKVDNQLKGSYTFDSVKDFFSSSPYQKSTLAAYKTAYKRYVDFSRQVMSVRLPFPEIERQTRASVQSATKASRLNPLPDDVVAVLRHLNMEHRSFITDVSRMFWNNEAPSGIVAGIPTRKFRSKLVSQSYVIQSELVRILEKYAAPVEGTALVPQFPGSQISYPARLIRHQIQVFERKITEAEREGKSFPEGVFDPRTVPDMSRLLEQRHQTSPRLSEPQPALLTPSVPSFPVSTQSLLERMNENAEKSRFSQTSSISAPTSRLLSVDPNDPDYYGVSGVISLDLEAFANSRPRGS